MSQYEKFLAVTSALDKDPWASAVEYPVSDWQYKVQNGDTRSSYRDWVISKTEPDGEFTDGCRLHIFAEHVAKIMNAALGNSFGCFPCEGVNASIEKYPNGQYKINGRSVGNCWGAVKQFTNMVVRRNPKIILDTSGEWYEIPPETAD